MSLFSKLFKKFVQETKPVFPPGLFLTGGRAIKFSTHGKRTRKLPSSDYDFKYVTPKKPNVNKICLFFKTLVDDFVVYTGLKNIRVETRTKIFNPPVLQNPYFKRYSYGFCDFGIVYRGKTYDLVDVVMMKGPYETKLDRVVSAKYGLPIPKLEHLYTETAMVVAKSLVSTNRNGWRNPISSTSKKHQQKGKRNVNRLIVMGEILGKKNNKNVHVIAELVKRPRLPLRNYIGKLVGEHMLARF